MVSLTSRVAMNQKLIEEILGLAYNDHYWKLRLAGDPEQGAKDGEFPTAVVLHALKRYEIARGRIPFGRGRGTGLH